MEVVLFCVSQMSPGVGHSFCFPMDSPGDKVNNRNIEPQPMKEKRIFTNNNSFQQKRHKPAQQRGSRCETVAIRCRCFGPPRSQHVACL
jgi:hypothetical protein